MTTTVFYRPGCPFCIRLRVVLKSQHVRARWINIREHDDAAAYVRSVAGGNETVPTVVTSDWVATNPRPRDVVAATRRKRCTK